MWMLELLVVGDEKKSRTMDRDIFIDFVRSRSIVLLYYSSDRDIFGIDLFVNQEFLDN
jgi:hypothetical protein